MSGRRKPQSMEERLAARAKRLTQRDGEIARRSYLRMYNRMAGRLNTAFTVIAFMESIYEFLTQDVDAVVRDTLRAIGLDWRDDDQLSVDGLSAVISRMTGIHFSNVLDPAAIKADILAEAASRVEDATGFRPTTFEPVALKAEFVTFVTESIKENSLVGSGARIATMAKHVAWDAKRRGYTDFAQDGWAVHLRRWNNRAAQKTYSENFKQAWKLRAMWVRQWNPGQENFGPWSHVVSKKRIWKTWKKNQRIYRVAMEQDAPGIAQYGAARFIPDRVPFGTQYAPTDMRRKMPRRLKL